MSNFEIVFIFCFVFIILIFETVVRNLEYDKASGYLSLAIVEASGVAVVLEIVKYKVPRLFSLWEQQTKKWI